MEFHITGIVVSKGESVKDNRFSRFIVLGQVSNADEKIEVEITTLTMWGVLE